MIPIGSVLNLGLQTTAVLLLLISMPYAWKAYRAKQKDPNIEVPEEETHGKLVDVAIVAAVIGALVWMVPSIFLGWYYTPWGIGYGTGGYLSYFILGSGLLPHWYLIALHVPIGALSGILAVYLLLRMQVKNFPKRLMVKRYHAWMVFTFSIWLLNAAIGYAIFYYYVIAGIG
jgi:hypothetical protein